MWNPLIEIIMHSSSNVQTVNLWHVGLVTCLTSSVQIIYHNVKKLLDSYRTFAIIGSATVNIYAFS